MATAALATALVVGLLGPAGRPATAEESLSGEPVRTVPVWPGVERQEWRLTNVDGDAVRAQVARVDPDAPVDVDLAFGQGELAGLETVPSMASERTGEGAVLGINGGFWGSAPWGRPQGFTVHDGHLVSEAEVHGDPGVGRGAFGLHPDGSMLIDRIRAQDVTLDGAAQPSLDATGVNRVAGGSDPAHADDEHGLYLVTDRLGSSVTLPEDPDADEDDNGDGDGGDEANDNAGAENDDEPSDPEPRGPARGRPLENLTAVPRGPGEPGAVGAPAREAEPGETLPIPSGGGLLVGYGDAHDDVEALAPETLTAETSLEPHHDNPQRWGEVELALTGGPHLLRGGEMTDGWDLEGFGPGHHSRHPRTAVGVSGDGTILLVTVDGRQDESAGLGTAELASFFQQLDATDAVMLDGGGSTTMTQDTVAVNEPSDGAPRPVSNAVFVQHRKTFTATERLAGAGREHTAAAVARAGFPDGASEAVVAAGADFPDALAGGPLAATLDAPLLLANPAGVSDVTLSALGELGVGDVTVLGGESAVPDEAVEQLEDAGHEVDRVAGGTRFATAAEIAGRVAAHEGAADPRRVVLASGLDFADALVAAAPAGMMDAPVLLAAPEQLTDATEDALAALDPDEVVVVGGTAAVSEEVAGDAEDAADGAEVTRLSGPTRFATARAINEWAEEELGGDDGGALDAGLVVARGDRFPDALAGGPLGAARGQLLMIVPPWDVHGDGDATAYLQRRGDRGLQEASLLGGADALTGYQQWQLEQLTGS